MSHYKVVVVGTDGSESSFRAVDRAAAIAAKARAKLVIASAYLPEDEHHSGEPDQLKGENYRTQGSAPIYGMLREANADLLVVGNVGLNSIAGRLLGSVPREVRRRAKTEVLVAETKD